MRKSLKFILNIIWAVAGFLSAGMIYFKLIPMLFTGNKYLNVIIFMGATYVITFIAMLIWTFLLTDNFRAKLLKIDINVRGFCIACHLPIVLIYYVTYKLIKNFNQTWNSNSL